MASLPLPACSARFTGKKAAILAQLARPADEYTDASPKGSVDVGVQPLLEVINAVDGMVTTSSCAGRVAVFLEGQRKSGGEQDEEDVSLPQPTVATTRASAGGKGGGGAWLFVSHEPFLSGKSVGVDTDWAAEFGLERCTGDGTEGAEEGEDDDEARLVHFKFEPMILHVLTASLAHAQMVLRCAMAAGFRESGAVSIWAGGASGGDDSAVMPVVAVRTMGLALASVIGIGTGVGAGVTSASETRARCTASRRELARLVRVADRRFAENRARTERFRAALVAAVGPLSGGRVFINDGWEDAETRRARKRAEGLQRQAALKQKKEAEEEQEKSAEAPAFSTS